MTMFPSSPHPRQCQAGHPCDRVPCFQARLEATQGRDRVRRNACTCAGHLGDTVQALTVWARDRGLQGKVTVLAIDQPADGQPASTVLTGGWGLRSFAFGTVLLTP